MRFYFAAIFAAFFALRAYPVCADTIGLVRGTVTVASVPAPGAEVTLRGEGIERSTSTDAAGAFAFSRVPFGTYSLIVRAKGTPERSRSLDVQSNAVVDVAVEAGELRRIGRSATALTRGTAAAPVSVNSLTRAQIATLPQNQSLNSVVQTFPGVVHFSYNEAIAHGFHGLTYELDGVPLPLGTASNFSEAIDPRTIDSLEVYTGAFPAEYGGSRQGAVVNVLSHRGDLDTPVEGRFTSGAGSYGSAQASVAQSLRLGNTRLFVNANLERTNRGIDSPTFDPVHDAAAQSNQFVRSVTRLGAQDTLAFDLSNSTSLFQIPINTTFNPNDPIVVPPGTNDVQREYARFANAAFTHTRKDGSAFTQIVPWYRFDRIAYDGDVQNQILGTVAAVGGTLSGLRQDRRSEFSGLRIAHFQAFGKHALKAGVEGSVENFSGVSQIAYFDQNGVLQPPFTDRSMQRGTQFGAYVQDKWAPTSYVSVFAGLRYDHSTGFVGGAQLSPRIEVNAQVDPQDVVHVYYGQLYAAPFLEDTRRAAVVLSATPGALPVYDLKPERDAYYEIGLAHAFSPQARGYVNLWKRHVRNVLDTTQLANTPVFAVFNNAVGIAQGVEGRVDARLRGGDAMFFSATLSKSLAGGVSGSTFLFPPQNATDVTLNPEDHDQAFTATFDYTKRFGNGRSLYASLEPQYATGYPVQFQNGSGRLAPHLTFNASVGREARRGPRARLGFALEFQNFTNSRYLLKTNNGFNTTQWGPGFAAGARVTAPI